MTPRGTRRDVLKRVGAVAAAAHGFFNMRCTDRPERDQFVRGAYRLGGTR